MSSYTDDYRILGVSSNCTLDALKEARRRCVKTWHPDHFPAGSEMRRQAEERIKDINTAFDRLIGHYDEFGSLPGPSETDPRRETIVVSEETIVVSEPTAPHAQSAGSRRRSSVFDAQAPIDRERIRIGLVWATMLAAVVVVVVTAYVALRHADDQAPTTGRSTEQAPPAPAAEASDTARPSRHKRDEYFTVGSSLGEVYAIQGIPTSTANDVWHYGKSSVYFADGVVTSWDEDPENPLKASLVPAEAPKKTMPTFTLGSSKTEVRAAEGAPLVETAEVWDYGLSRVYFRDDRVVGWDSSPMRPLKARK